MAGELYKVSAQLAGYASELPPNHGRMVFSILADVATGQVATAEAVTAVSRLDLPPKAPRFGRWLETPEGSVAVAERIALQRAYDDTYREPAKMMSESGNPSFRPPGVHFTPFFLPDVQGEPIVAKFATSPQPLAKALVVEEATAALLVARNLHPRLEKVRGISYKLGAVATKFIPGDNPEELTERQIRAITEPQIREGFAVARAAGEQGLLFDYKGSPVKISTEEGFGFLNFTKVGLERPTVVARNAYGLLAMTIGRLGKRAAWTPGLHMAALAVRGRAQRALREVVPQRYLLREAAEWYDKYT